MFVDPCGLENEHGPNLPPLRGERQRANRLKAALGVVWGEVAACEDRKR